MHGGLVGPVVLDQLRFGAIGLAQLQTATRDREVGIDLSHLLFEADIPLCQLPAHHVWIDAARFDLDVLSQHDVSIGTHCEEAPGRATTRVAPTSGRLWRATRLRLCVAG